MHIFSIICGLVSGGIVAYLIFYLLHKTKAVPLTKFNELSVKHQELLASLKASEEKINNLQTSNTEVFARLNNTETAYATLLSRHAVTETQLAHSQTSKEELLQKLQAETETSRNQQAEIYHQKEIMATISAKNNALDTSLHKQEIANEKQVAHIEELARRLTTQLSQLSSLQTHNESLTEKLTTQKKEVEELQKSAHLQFEKIANKLLEEKSSKFTEANKINLEALLQPLKEDITNFKFKIEQTHTEDTKQRSSLEEKILGLIQQTNRVSTEANNLAAALKGKPHKRGGWGEMILERILEMSGLTKDREYFVQENMKDEEGNNLRPDVRIHLPDRRVIMIDSKVSLIAYDNFSATDDADLQKLHLSKHLQATYNHIEQLSKKQYDNLGSTLDFTMMFVPIEPAYMLTIQADEELWTKAYEKRILLVSPTNLIACLKLFSDLWKRDHQSKNAAKIVKHGEALYDKLVLFSKTFEEIGDSLRSSQIRYDKALSQLKDGKGNLINQGVQFKNLGLKSAKRFSEKMLADSNAYEEEEPGIEAEMPE